MFSDPEISRATRRTINVERSVPNIPPNNKNNNFNNYNLFSDNVNFARQANVKTNSCENVLKPCHLYNKANSVNITNTTSSGDNSVGYELSLPPTKPENVDSVDSTRDSYIDEDFSPLTTALIKDGNNLAEDDIKDSNFTTMNKAATEENDIRDSARDEFVVKEIKEEPQSFSKTEDRYIDKK